MQTKQPTLHETVGNIGVVLIITLIITFLVFPLVAIDATPGQMTGIAVIFTVISSIRDYIFQRFFNEKNVPTI